MANVRGIGERSAGRLVTVGVPVGVATMCLLLVLCAPFTAAAAVGDIAQAVEDVAEGDADAVAESVDGTIKTSVQTVDSTVDTSTKTVTETVDKTADTTSGTIDKTVTTVTETVDTSSETVDNTVEGTTGDALDQVEQTVGGGATTTTSIPTTTAPTSAAPTTASNAEASGASTTTSAVDAEGGGADVSGTAAQPAPAPAGQPRAAGDEPTSVTVSVGAVSMSPDRVFARHADADASRPRDLLATVRIRDAREPFVAAVEIDADGSELRVHLQPVEQPPLPNAEDDRGATSPFKATVTVAEEEPFRAAVRFVARDDGLVVLVDPIEGPLAGVTEVLGAILGRLASTGLDVLALSGLGVALITVGGVLVGRIRQERRRLPQAVGGR